MSNEGDEIPLPTISSFNQMQLISTFQERKTMLDKSFIIIKIPIGINNLRLKLSESQKYFECVYERANDMYIDEEMSAMFEELKLSEGCLLGIDRNMKMKRDDINYIPHGRFVISMHKKVKDVFEYNLTGKNKDILFIKSSYQSTDIYAKSASKSFSSGLPMTKQEHKA